MAALQFYNTNSLRPGFCRTDDHFSFVYADQEVGNISRMITGSTNDGRWSWHITVAHQGRYDPSWQGWADTPEEGKAAFAKRFREWIDKYGELKPIPEWSRFNVKYVSELMGI